MREPEAISRSSVSMKLIGLVGGIASGKSFVAGILAKLGAKVIDADQLAHQVLNQPEVIDLIVEHFGSQVRGDDGKLLRSELAGLVFGNDSKSQQELDWLESQLHPRIHQLVLPQLEQWRQQGVKAAVLDAPVLIKAGWHHQCDEIIFVQCDISIRQQRASRRGWDENELKRRESNQTSLPEKRRHATFVVHSDVDADKTRKQLEEFWQQKIS